MLSFFSYVDRTETTKRQNRFESLGWECYTDLQIEIEREGDSSCEGREVQRSMWSGHRCRQMSNLSLCSVPRTETEGGLLWFLHGCLFFAVLWSAWNVEQKIVVKAVSCTHFFGARVWVFTDSSSTHCGQAVQLVLLHTLLHCSCSPSPFHMSWDFALSSLDWWHKTALFGGTVFFPLLNSSYNVSSVWVCVTCLERTVCFGKRKNAKTDKKNGNPTVCMTTNEPNVKIEPFAFVSDQRLYASPFFPPIEGRRSTQGVVRRSAKKKHHANDRIESKRPMNWLGAGEKGTKSRERW